MINRMAISFVVLQMVALHSASGIGVEWELSQTSVAERTVSDLLTLIADEAVFPQDFRQRMEGREVPGDFSPQRYFTVLKHLSMERGYTLGYVYYWERAGAEPLLTAVKVGDPVSAFTDSIDLASSKADGLRHIVADGSEESYLELAQLAVVGTHFYRYWHAQYHDWIPVCGEDSLRSVLNGLAVAFGKPNIDWGSEFGIELAMGKPKITPGKETTKVSILAFSQFSGLVRIDFQFRTSFPHEIESCDSDSLIAYNCGLLF